MNESIVELGYRPKIVQSRVDLGSTTRGSSGAIPELVAAAIGRAAEHNKLLFVDFYAEWCGACKTMDRTTFQDPTVKNALEQFVFLKVDADLYPGTARHFKVVGMPTLVVLDASGQEVYRQVGPIGAAELAQALKALLTVPSARWSTP